jgi:hypothetical protein
MASGYQEKLINDLKDKIAKIAKIIDNLSPDFPPEEDVIEEVQELRIQLKYMEGL